MINLVFRKHPEVGPTGKVSIFGRALCSAERMRAYAYRRNPKAPDVAVHYLEQGERYGIRADVAFCQAMLDTQVWKADPQGPPWKPFAHAIWSAADPAWTEDELKRRTELHYRRLNELVSGRGEAVACWEDLNGKWTLPGHKYGQDIVAIWRNMMEWKGEGEVMEEMEEAAFGEQAEGPIPARRFEGTAAEDLRWLEERGILPAPSPHPERKVTWAELARVMRLLDQGRQRE
ncbi:hypothetical protein GE107_21670 [Cohnella sp. CFH 77786]|uniref:glucosaminidase domain-containing protein n=1 Tax=Cohnella sp. CFH 77786 TaxID=2662265 RepID=UPI001C60ED4A|nr:glucosaminidase domain-containing protein [Cohnella sp. CFH 77786]MBW5448658.1 hypothetical protein [Cohnella sp. CFH 77786]